MHHRPSFLVCLILACALVAPAPARTALRQEPATETTGTLALPESFGQVFPSSTIGYVEGRRAGAILRELGGLEAVIPLLAFLAPISEAKIEVPPLPLTPEEIEAAYETDVAVAFVPAAGQSNRAIPEIAGLVRAPAPEVAEMLVARASLLTTVFNPGKSSAKTIRSHSFATLMGGQLVYARFGADIVFGTPKGVEAMLTAAAGPPSGTLSAKPGFQSARGRFSGQGRLFGYAEGQWAMHGFFGVPNDQANSQAAAISAFVGTDTVQGFGFGVELAPDGVRFEASAELDRSRKTLLSAISSPPPITSRAAAFIPNDARQCLTASIDLNQLYDLVLVQVNPETSKTLDLPTVQEMESRFKLAMGMGLQEGILSAFGTEMMVAGGFAPKPVPRVPKESRDDESTPVDDVAVPEYTAEWEEGADDAVLAEGAEDIPYVDPRQRLGFLEVRDPVRARRVLESAGRHLRGMYDDAPQGKSTDSQATTYRGIDLIRTASGPAAIVDGLAILGTQGSLERALDAYLDGTSLMLDPGYTRASSDRSGQTIAAFYFAPGPFAAYLRKFVGPSRAEAIPEGVGLFAYVEKDAAGVQLNLRIPVPVATLLAQYLDTSSSGYLGQNQESAAMGMLRMLGSAEATYIATHERVGTIEQMIEEKLLDETLMATRTVDGYRIVEARIDPEEMAFEFRAEPIDAEARLRSFTITEDYVIRSADGPSAPPGTTGTPIGGDNSWADDPNFAFGRSVDDLLRLLESFLRPVFIDPRRQSEAVVIQTLFEIYHAQQTYVANHGAPGTIGDLVRESLIDSELLDRVESVAGYRIVEVSVDARGYTYTAEPIASDRGHRSFTLTEEGVRHLDGPRAPARGEGRGFDDDH